MAKDVAEQYESLLERSTDSDVRKERSCFRRNSVQIGLGVVIVLLLVYNAIITTISLQQRRTKTSVAYSPAESVRQPKITEPWKVENESKYIHGPQPEMNTAWEDLLTGLNVRVSEEEMYRTQKNFSQVNDVVTLTDGDFVGILGVYHALHCLDLLRVGLNREDYSETYLLDPINVAILNKHHFNHCIDNLRDHVMCQPDLTLYRLTWDTEKLDGTIIRSSSDRECVNWDRVDSWARARAVNPWSWSVDPNPYITQ